MKKVNMAFRQDMESYIEGFKPDNYDWWWGPTDPSVIQYLREYYDEHLPVDVNAWFRVNEPNKDLMYAECVTLQVRFIRDIICKLLRPNYEEFRDNLPQVISVYYPKSKPVKLPVFQINLEKYGVELVLRYNVDNWKISIKSEDPLYLNHSGLFNPKEEFSYLDCEGLPEDKVYGSYDQSHSKFTIRVSSDYDLYTLMFLLKNDLGIKKED